MAESTPSTQRDRHCAYCLKFLPSGTAKVCGKCHRRAYCDRDCQKADWKQELGTQGHKNWCGLPCGEEDIDWKVRPVPGKGLGIIAKRPIPAKYRIMVDALRPYVHPGVKDLAPIGGTLAEKVYLNVLGCGNIDVNVICLRICRINHDCAPNSDHFFDSTHDVKCLYAGRDIQAGEEITITYTQFQDFNASNHPSYAKELLVNKYGIICKGDCFCRDVNNIRLVGLCKAYDRIGDDFAACGEIDSFMDTTKKLIESYENLGPSLRKRMFMLYYAYQIGIGRESTFQEAVEFLCRAYEIGVAILHPNSEEFLDLKKYMDDPKSHAGYLKWEK